MFQTREMELVNADRDRYRTLRIVSALVFSERLIRTKLIIDMARDMIINSVNSKSGKIIYTTSFIFKC